MSEDYQGVHSSQTPQCAQVHLRVVVRPCVKPYSLDSYTASGNIHVQTYKSVRNHIVLNHTMFSTVLRCMATESLVIVLRHGSQPRSARAGQTLTSDRELRPYVIHGICHSIVFVLCGVACSELAQLVSTFCDHRSYSPDSGVVCAGGSHLPSTESN